MGPRGTRSNRDARNADYAERGADLGQPHYVDAQLAADELSLQERLGQIIVYRAPSDKAIR